MKQIKTACIIDDDDIFRFIMKKHIENQNLAEVILMFENGEQAIQHFLEFANQADKLPDVVFLDINMPVMNGWDFVTAYHHVRGKLAKDATIFMISSSVDDRDVTRAKHTDVIADYLTKPLDKELVHQLISKCYVHS